MDLKEAIQIALEADQEVVDNMQDGLAKKEVKKIRQLAVEIDEEPENEQEDAEEPSPPLGYANDLHSTSPDEHRTRSDPFTDNQTTANWLLGTLETALQRTDITPEQLKAVTDEAIRRHQQMGGGRG